MIKGVARVNCEVSGTEIITALHLNAHMTSATGSGSLIRGFG